MTDWNIDLISEVTEERDRLEKPCALCNRMASKMLGNNHCLGCELDKFRELVRRFLIVGFHNGMEEGEKLWLEAENALGVMDALESSPPS